MLKLTRVSGLLALCLLLAACPRPVRPPPPAPSAPPEPAVDTRGATLYEISSRDSQVSIHVFRGGKLARLGHNHVVVSRHVSGRAWIHPQFVRSGLELRFPVNELIVDEAEARRAAGSDFPPDVAQADKDGTRANMLKPELLDGARYPEVKLRSARVNGTLQAPQVTARITIKDASRDVEVPVKIALEGARLRATGEFDILQTQFGIEPFSAALGALQVQDRLHIQFRIVAKKQVTE